MDFLFVETPDGQNFKHELGETTIRLGRGRVSDLRLEDAHVSRLHAEISHRLDGYYIRDVGGKSGTFVNDARITDPQLLQTGDTIRLGKTRLIFNAFQPSSVEFSDHPLPDSTETTAIPVDHIPTPPDLSLYGPLGVSGPPIPRIATGGPAQVQESPAAGEGLEVFSPDFIRDIIDADRELVFNRPPDEILDQMMNLVRKSVPFERGVLMLKKKGELVPEVVRVYSETPMDFPVCISRTISDRVLNNLEAVLTTDALADERFREGESIQAQNIRSAMCVPLWDQNEVTGFIYVDSPRLPGQFNRKDLLVLTHLAYIVSGKIEQKKLFDRAVAARTMELDLQRAAEIQKSLLPSGPPDIPGYRLHGNSIPCFAVGGDYFDFIDLEDGRFAIALGDVAGKGLPAAMLMCCFQSTLRALITLDLPPDETVTRLNQLLCPTFPDNRYVTFFYGILDPVKHTLTWVNAAHNPPFLITREGTSRSLDSTSGAVGTFDTLIFSARTDRLEPGDLLFCYSDGATEAQNPDGAFFGSERLLALVRESRGEVPDALGRMVEDRIDRFLTGMPHNDDLTLVVMKRDLPA